MFEAIQRNEEKVKWGPQVEKIDLMSRVKTPDGKVIGENLRLDFQTGEVWVRVGCLDTQGEGKSLPKTPKYNGMSYDCLGVILKPESFTVSEFVKDEAGNDVPTGAPKTMWGHYSIWQAPGELIQLIRRTNTPAAKAAETGTRPAKRS
jgi:hypothetical protein